MMTVSGAPLRGTGSRPTGQAPAGLVGSRFDPARTLAVVLAELMLAQGELDRLMNRPGVFVDGVEEMSPEQEARWSKLEDTIWLRRDEAKAIIETATGVSWDAIEGANL